MMSDILSAVTQVANIIGSFVEINNNNHEVKETNTNKQPQTVTVPTVTTPVSLTVNVNLYKDKPIPKLFDVVVESNK